MKPRFSSLGVLVACAMFLSGAAAGCLGSRNAKFNEITVQRIKVVEPDGTLRMVISNKAKLPGVILRGKEEHQEDRPYAGMLFYNNEGSENGGLVFGGHKNGQGEVVESGGSLSFDKYDANQIVQLAGVDDKEDKFAGLAVSESDSKGKSPRRIWVGREADGVAAIALMDGNGHKRLLLEVPAEGTPRIAFLDQNGKIVNELAPAKTIQ